MGSPTEPVVGDGQRSFEFKQVGPEALLILLLLLQQGSSVSQSLQVLGPLPS